MRRWLVPLGCVLAVGCVPAADPTPTPTPVVSVAPTPSPTPTPSPSPSPTPSPTAFPSFPADMPTEDPETAAIIAGWQEYLRVYEKFAADPVTPVDVAQVQWVTTGTETSAFLGSLDKGRERRIKLVGPQQFRAVTVGTVTPSADGAKQSVISYCVDSSRVQLINIDTNQQVQRTTSPTFLESATMERGADGVWRVGGISNREASC